MIGLLSIEIEKVIFGGIDTPLGGEIMIYMDM
jgi:hypothetical protein